MNIFSIFIVLSATCYTIKEDPFDYFTIKCLVSFVEVQ